MITTLRNATLRCAFRVAPMLGACVFSAALGACASSPPVDPGHEPMGLWQPATTPNFVTIQRDTSFVLGEGADDLLVYATDLAQSGGGGGDATIGRVAWLVEIPADAGPDDRFAFIGATDEGAPRGWAIRRDATGTASKPVALSGFVSVLERSVDGMLVDLKLFPIDDPETPDLVDQVEFRLAQRPVAIATPDPDTRSGVAHRKRPGPPARRPTDAVWPWGELVGEYPLPRPGEQAR